MTNDQADQAAPRQALFALLHSLQLPESARRAPPSSVTGAAMAGDTALVQAFLDRGGDIEERSIGFASPLQAVAGGGRLELVEFLLSRGADPKEKPDAVYSPLSAAAMHGHVAVVRRLIQAIADLSGETKAAAHAAAHGQAACLRLLLDAGAPLGAHAGQTLRVAAWQGRFACVRMLVEAGVDPREHPDYQRDLFGEPVDKPYRPRDAAVENGHTLIATYLDGKPVGDALAASAESEAEARGAGLVEGLEAVAGAISGTRRAKRKESAPLQGEARADAAARALELVRSGALGGRIDEPGPAGWPPLAMAAAAGHLDIVGALLEAGASPGAAGPEGSTALIEAARYGHAAVVARLLRSGADANQRSQRKETPLMAAAGRGDLECVRLLLVAGADPNARMRGKSARGFATGVYKGEIRELLEKFAGGPSSRAAD
jgi:ankyrin repeat protein